MGEDPYLTLVILYTCTVYFILHQGSHLSYLDAGRVELSPIFSLLMRIEQLAWLLVLVWYGYRTVWYYPLELAAIGVPAVLVPMAIERAIRLTRHAWAISILGTIIVPVLLYLMVVHINTLSR